MTTEERIKNLQNMSSTLTQISEAIFRHCDDLRNSKSSDRKTQAGWSGVVYFLEQARDEIEAATAHVDRAIDEAP